MSLIWLISIGWSDTSFVDFLVRSSSHSTTKLDIFHWFFANIDTKFVQYDYSPLDNIEGDLDFSRILNKDIEHENLNINQFEDFIQLNLAEIELFMRENGKVHGMVVTVDQAKEQNYEIINLDENPTAMVWKVTYNPRFLNCTPYNDLPNLYDVQQSTKTNYLWQIRAKQEHHVYQYMLSNLNQFNIESLPELMNKTQNQLIDLVRCPLAQTEHKFVSEMINIQCCQITGQHQHTRSEQEKYVILVEPALDLLNIIDI